MTSRRRPARPRWLVGEPVTITLVVGLVAVFAGISIATTEGAVAASAR